MYKTLGVDQKGRDRLVQPSPQLGMSNHISVKTGKKNTFFNVHFHHWVKQTYSKLQMRLL